MKTNFVLYAVAVCLLLYACSGTVRQELPTVTDAWVTEHPDSAFTLLDNLLFPEELPLPERAEYARLRAKACVETGKSFVQDTLLETAIGYYKSCGDSLHLSECYQLNGVRLLGRNDHFSALNSLLSALQFLPQSADSLRFSLYDTIVQQALMASRYDVSRNYARKMIMSTDDAFRQLGYYMLAVSLGWEAKKKNSSALSDSSFLYMEKAVVLAEAHPGKLLPHYLRNSVSYRLPEQESLRRLHKVIALQGESSNALADIAHVFLMAHRLDSADSYLGRAERLYAQEWQSRGSEYVSMRNELALLRSCLKYACGQKDFFEFPGSFNDSIYFADERNKRIWEEQSALQCRNAARNLYYQQQRQHMQILVMAAVLALLVTVAGILQYIRRKRNRWMEVEERAETLQRLLDDARQAVPDAPHDSHFFKKILLQQLGIIRLMATAPTEQNKDLLQQAARISGHEVPAGDLLNWADLYPVIDSLYDNFHLLLVEQYGDLLNEREVQLCCLLIAGFSTKEISVVSGQSPRTVYQRKSDIRRKLRMEEGKDIVVAIKNSSLRV